MIFTCYVIVYTVYKTARMAHLAIEFIWIVLISS